MVFNLRKLRKQKRFTQAQLSKECNLSQSYLSKIETGRVEPNFKVMKVLAKTLNEPISSFFE